jgi:drug/metabolite transporter (DMT)-like permease
MKYTLASVACILGRSSTFWIPLFSVLFLCERVSRRSAIAAVLAPSGVMLVTLG